MPGLLEGTTTIGELLTHGDTGIGTGEGLDGELIILDGVAYKVGQSGVAERVPDDFTMPFANVHHAAFQYQCERRDIGLEDLNNRIVEANGRANADNYLSGKTQDGDAYLAQKQQDGDVLGKAVDVHH